VDTDVDVDVVAVVAVGELVADVGVDVEDGVEETIPEAVVVGVVIVESVAATTNSGVVIGESDAVSWGDPFVGVVSVVGEAATVEADGVVVVVETVVDNVEELPGGLSVFIACS